MFLFKIVVNILNVKFTTLTIFECTVEWHEAHCHCAAVTTTHPRKTETLYPLNNNSLSVPSTPAPAPTILLLVAVNFTLLRTSCRQNQAVFALLCWASPP